MVVRQSREVKVMKNSTELNVVRKAGGSIVEHPAVFSSDSKYLFVTWGNSVRSYSVETGDFVTCYEGLSRYAVGVSLHPCVPDRIIAISCTGELIEWHCSNKENNRFQQLRNIKLGRESEPLTVLSYFVITLEDEGDVCAVCLIKTAGNFLAEVRVFSIDNGEEKHLPHKIRADDNSRSLSLRQTNNETLMAAISNQSFACVTFSIVHGSEMKVKRATSKNFFTCVACHPEEHCVITGDITGCIRVWRNLFGKPFFASYHWHTLPVRALVFSGSGTYFFSGGDECVLVKWLLDSPNDKVFVPRLPAEILCLAMSSDNLLIAVSTKNNAIQLVDSTTHLIGSIQHFSWATVSSNIIHTQLLSEMSYDPRSKSLVMNAHTGHIQFFSAEQGNLSYLLDVVGRNYLTQTRSGVVKNTDVVRFAFSPDGRWLATVELCENHGIYPSEIRLKFWDFDKMKNSYILNTSVENPHKGKIYAIQFRPPSNSEKEMCITTGEDMKFRTWVVEEFQVIKLTKTETNYRWIIENIGFYRNLPVRELSFSVDGSLMAVTFGPTLTVWVPGTNEIKCSLTPPNVKENLTHVKFGQKSIHLIVTGSSSSIAVWNLLSLSLLWVVPFKLSVLVSDPESDVMAAFSLTNDVVIFSPNSHEPIFKQNSLNPPRDASIINAIFVPHMNNSSNKISWQSNSQLYFFNSRQELLSLEDQSQDSSASEEHALDVMPATYKHQTGYSALLAEQSRSDVVSITRKQHLQLGVPGLKTLNDFLSGPAHTMPPLSLLSYPILLSFLMGKEEGSEKTIPLKLTEKKDKMETDDSEDDTPSKTLTSTFVSKDRKEELSKIDQQIEVSVLAEIEKNLSKISRQSLDWVSDLV